MRAVLPLVIESFSQYGMAMKRLRFPGNVHCCRFDLVRCAGAEGEEAVRSIWNSLKEVTDWDVLDICHVPEGGGAEQLQLQAQADGFLAHRVPEWFSLYLPIEEPHESQQPWLARTSQKFRANLRRTRRQIEELGQVRFRHFDQADPEMLAQFYELERSSWKGKQGTAIACSERTRDFYDRVAGNAARHGYLSLDFMEIDGRPVSAHLGFRVAGRYYLAKAAYDDSFRRYGPGQLLVHEVLQRWSEWDLNEFDFTGPATWDESRWTSKVRRLSRIYVFNNHWCSRLLYGRLTFKPKLKKVLGVEAPVVCELLSCPENVSDAFIVPEGVSIGDDSRLRKILKRIWRS